MAVGPELAWAAPSKGVSLLCQRARSSFDRLRTNEKPFVLSLLHGLRRRINGPPSSRRHRHCQRSVMLHQAQQFLIRIRLAQVMVDADFPRMFTVLLRNA